MKGLRSLSLTGRSVNNLFLTVIGFFLFGQVLNAQVFAEPEILYCNSIGQDEGLLQLNVKCLSKDDLGYLWIGTEDGLLRYNGYEFKAYLHDPADSSSIPDDHIRGMQFTGGKLWLATNSKGIRYFLPAENRFYDFTGNLQESDLYTAYKILSPVEDTLMFSLKNNLFMVDKNSGINSRLTLPLSEKECVVNDVVHLSNEKFLMATTSAGILEVDKSQFKINETGLLIQNTNNCFYRVSDTLFIGTEEGLFIYNLTKKRLIKTIFNSPVNCFYTINENSFYLGTDVGLYSYNFENSTITPTIIRTQNDVLHDQIDINQIMGDEKGNLWVGTEGDGLFHFNRYQKKFSPIKLQLKEFPLTSNISTFQLLPDKDSTLWLGTKYGIVKYSHATGEFKFYDSKDRPLIYSLKKDINGTIWAGGFTSGLLRYNSYSDQFEKINANLPDNDIVEIIPMDNDNLWVCTWAGGIHKFNIKSAHAEEVVVNGERINRARTSLVDSNGNIWLGTDFGAYCISALNEVKHYTEKAESDFRLSADRIFSIVEDNDGNIWFGTNVGLTKLDVKTQRTTLFYKQKGLPNDFIYSALIAPNNDVWVSTNYGISVLRHSTNSFTNFTVSDGLQHNEFNGKAGFSDSDGNIYFGGISGFNIFHPDEIVENPHLPRVFVESVDLFNTPVNRNKLFADELSFKSRENVLTFNYAALNFIEPEKCNFQYMMEGFDVDWRPVTKARNTTYTNLDQGTYTFKVRATNDAGIWSPFSDELKIVIVPPWYATTWFRIIFVFLFLLSGILFYWYQTSKLKSDKIRLEQIISNRTQEVQQKNTALQIALREVEIQRDNIGFLMKEMRHRINNNLQIISSLLNIQATRLENQKAVDALQMAKNRILTIANVENKISTNSGKINIGIFIKDVSENIINALSNEETLKFKTDFQVSDQLLMNINTTLIGLILNELITNVTKYAFDQYSPINILTIGCKVEEDKLVIVVADNGKGYQQAEVRKNSMGISLVRSMVDQLNGELSVVCNNGTTNEIEIPL